jgi:hypothetical protein
MNIENAISIEHGGMLRKFFLAGIFATAVMVSSACGAADEPAAVPSPASTQASGAEAKGTGDPATDKHLIWGVWNRKADFDFKLNPQDVGAGGLWIITKSPKLSRMLMQDMAARGYKLAESQTTATTLMSIEPLMTLEKKGRQMNLNLPALFEQQAKTDPDLAAGNVRQGLEGGSLGGSYLMQGGRVGGTVGGLFLLDAIVDFSGVAGKFNEMFTGDARGYCIAKLWGGCKSWDLVTHYTRTMLAVKFPDGTVKKGSVQSDSLIADTNIGLAFQMGWSDVNKALIGRPYGKCGGEIRDDCAPQ